MFNSELWNEILQMFDSSASNIELIGGQDNAGSVIVNDLKLNPQTTLSAVIGNVAGIKVNNTIRILGQGNQDIKGIHKINEVKCGMATKIRDLLIVATDVFGGFYAMNTAEGKGPVGEIFYFAPDTLGWEALNMKYSQFLYWTVHGNTDDFYSSMKWSDWEQIAKAVGFDEGILIYPFLWSNEINIETASKKIVPFEELFCVNMEYRNKFFK